MRNEGRRRISAREAIKRVKDNSGIELSLTAEAYETMMRDFFSRLVPMRFLGGIFGVSMESISQDRDRIYEGIFPRKIARRRIAKARGLLRSPGQMAKLTKKYPHTFERNVLETVGRQIELLDQRIEEEINRREMLDQVKGDVDERSEIVAEK